MNILTLLEATLKLGIPMVALSWVIFNWLYGDGGLDRQADRKAINAQIKGMKKTFKKSKEGGRANYVLGKWMWFGSGFYGLAALWTFVVIELQDIFRLLLNPTRIADAFAGGLIAGAIELLMNQIGNLIIAFVWFGYWADEGVIIWLLVAYFGYWVGIELARRDENLPLREWLEKLRSLRP